MLALTLVARAAVPLDGLEPPCTDSFVDEAASALLEGHTRRHAEMLVLPARGHASLVYVWRAVEEPFGQRADHDAYIFLKTWKEVSSLRRVVSVRAPIDAKTVAALEDLWNVALVDAHWRYHRNLPFLHATRFVFSDFTKEFGQRRAQGFASGGTTKIDALADVGALMVTYASAPESERAKRAAEMRDAAAELRRRFVSDNAAPPDVAQLDIDSVPSGASVVVDGKVYAAAPTTVSVTPNEIHVVELALDGFRAARVEARAPAGVVEVVRASLRPNYVNIKISSSHPVDEVRIDDVVVCTETPCVVSRRPEDGDAQLVITKKGCERYWSTVVVEPVVEILFHARMQCGR